MQRLELVHQWLAGLFPGRPCAVAPASADASFRRYFRATFDDGLTRIVMDAPPEHEDCRPFVRIAGLLRGAGVHAPEILAQDLERGLLLLTDLGDTTYLDALDDANADSLFRDALGALVKWQLASRPKTLPPYDEALLQRELNLFPEWYVARHLGTPLTPAQLETLERMQVLLLQNILAQPRVFVHRDYMPRNLMVCEDNPGVLDFQDAVHGPISYDVASLFRDAFLSWEEERVLDWVARYWEKARRANLPVDADFGAFYRDVEWMGLQRHLKVLGIFARINYRDGKPKYLADTPRFVNYVRQVAMRYATLTPLAHLFDELEKRTPQIGYTF
ncbi:MAG: phosphotransferase [Betaproteobacteria bacterium]|jgi:aminoglycoside/choline kinase family phosphotransferase|nr:phosphotransferase [Betaproteobacteria bacterium]